MGLNRYIQKLHRFSLFLFAFVVLYFSFASSVHAAIALVQSGSTYPGGAGPSGLAFGSANAAGNLIVVGIQGTSITSDPTVTDSKGNTYTKITSAHGGNGAAYDFLYYAKNIAAGANTVTVTLPGGGGDLGFHISEWSGLDTVSPLDASTTAVGTSTTTFWATPSITPAAANSLLIAFAGSENSAENFTATSGYTKLTEQPSHSSAVEYKIVSSISSYISSFTVDTTTDTWVMLMAVFKAASNAGTVKSPFAARSASYIVDPPSVHSISGLSTSASFKNLFAGGQTSNGFSSSTSFKVCAGQLCTLADFGGPNPAGIPYLSAYRWFANNDASSTGAALAAANTATTSPAQGTPFRLRALLHVPVIDLNPSDVNVSNFKLQFATKSGTCDTAWNGETYADVATGSGAIRYYNNSSVANAVAITASSSDPTHSGDNIVAQTYQEQNNFTATSTVSIGSDGLWDFALVDNSAPAGTTYCFRVVDTNSASATPEQVPEITTNASGPVITVSGTVYSDDGTTTTTSTVAISVNGGAKTTIDTNGSGVYTFSSISQPTAGDVITVWMDNNGGGNGLGAAVTLYSSGNITDLHIYKNELITRHENAGPLANGDIDACTKTLGAGCADSDLHFDVSGGALTVDNDWGLYLWGGKTFTPGGAVTLSPGAVASAKGGDIRWASSTSVLTLSNNALSVGGDFYNDVSGTFSTGLTHVLTFTGTNTGLKINSGGVTFRNIVFNGSGGVWSPATSTITVGSVAVATAGNFTMTAGTLDNSNGTASVVVNNGSVTGSGGTINLTNATFTIQMVATTSANFGSTSGDWTFNNLLFTNASTTATTFRFTTLTSGSGNINVGGVLQILSSPTASNITALDAGNRTWTLSGTGGIPLMLTSIGGTATFEAVSSTVAYTGNNTGGNTTMASTTYWSLNPGAGAGETYVFGTNTTVNNNFNFAGSGDTVDTTGVSLTVNNNYTHTAGTLSGTGNVTVKGALQFGGAATVNLTGGTFEHLIGATTTIQISTPLASSLTFNNLKMNNSTTTASTATLTMTSPSSGFTVSNDWTIGDNSSSTYILPMGGGITALTVDVNNDTTFGANALVRAATSTIRTARNLTVTGALTPASSTFQFDTTATSTIVGSTSLPLIFNNFTATTANKPLVFSTSTAYFEIRGALTLTGTAGNEVTLDSNASGTQWQINHQGTESVEYISLKDSGCIATSTDITVTSFNAIDRGNNDEPCWLITPTISVSGTVYSDEGITTTTSSVKLAVNGTTAYTTSTDGSGVYTFPTVYRPATSSVLTVWLDNGTTTKAGATVMKYIGNSNITDLHIFKNHLIARHDDGGPLTNTNIGVCDSATGSACADSDLHFNEASGNLTVDNDWGLYIWGGDTLTPGGNLTLSPGDTAANYGGDLKWASSTSVLDIAGNSLSVGGDWFNAINGTFTKWGTSTATFTATQSGMRIVPGTQSFASTTFNGSGGTWSASSTTMTVNGNITMTAGTINTSAGDAAIVVNAGDVTGTSGAFAMTTSSLTVSQPGSGSRTFGGTSANWSFYDLALRNTSTTSSPANFTFVGPGSVTTTIANALTIGNPNPIVMMTIWYASSSHVELAGATSTPLRFAGQGNVSFESSTIAFTGNNAGGNTTVPANSSYWDLVLNNASETYIPSMPLTANNDISIVAGTLDFNGLSVMASRDFNIGASGVVSPGSSALSIGRDFTNNGTFNSASSSVGFTLLTTTSTITGTSTFWNLTVSGTSKPVVFAANQTFTIGGQLYLQGSAGNLLTVDSSASGTQWFINHQGTEVISYASVKDSGCNISSTYISVSLADSVDRGNNGFCWLFPSLSFTISPLSVSMALNNTNTFTNTGTNTLTVSTNGEFGYNVTAYADSLLTRSGDSTTIANWTGTNAAPTTWTTTCIGSATCGFGYNTNDTDLTQFTSTKFAGFTTSTPGDVVATASGRVTGDATTMTYRASVDLTQKAGDYQTTIRYIVAPSF